MKKIKIVSIVVLLMAVILFALPPIAICKGGIMLGKRTESLKNAKNHMYGFIDTLLHKSSDFDNFYFINFRFWEQLEIKENEYFDDAPQPNIQSFLTLVYVVEQNRKGGRLNSFSVKRGHDYWYFDYILSFP